MEEYNEELQAAENAWINYDGGNDRKLHGYFIDGFGMGAKWGNKNKWKNIKRDSDGFAIDDSLGMVLIMEVDGTTYINDDDDYVHNVNCKWYMDIPKAPIVANSSKTCKK